MSEAALPDGRRVIATHHWARDWWVAQLRGERGGAREGRLLGAVLRELLDIPRGEHPEWLRAACEQLAGRQTPLGRRFRCRCCGYLTLAELGMYHICPVCRWEDDPTTIWAPGEGPTGPNHISLSEGRANFLRFGASDERSKNHVREPRPEEEP